MNDLILTIVEYGLLIVGIVYIIVSNLPDNVKQYIKSYIDSKIKKDETNNAQ